VLTVSKPAYSPAYAYAWGSCPPCSAPDAPPTLPPLPAVSRRMTRRGVAPRSPCGRPEARRMPAILLALASSLGYGASDFLAARVAQPLSAVRLALASQTLATLAVLAVVLVAHQPLVPAALLWGVASGWLSTLGLILYYQALTRGPAGVATPIAASGAVLPVVVSFTQGQVPTPVALLGLRLVLVGVGMTALEIVEPDEALVPLARGAVSPHPRRLAAVPRPSLAVGLAVLAALAFGLDYVLLDQGTAAAGAGVLWVTCGVQLGALSGALVGAGL